MLVATFVRILVLPCTFHLWAWCVDGIPSLPGLMWQARLWTLQLSCHSCHVMLACSRAALCPASGRLSRPSINMLSVLPFLACGHACCASPSALCDAYTAVGWHTTNCDFSI